MSSEYRRTTIPINRIMGAPEIRRHARISRSTFERWRTQHAFPKPFLVLEQGELWDSEQVDAWLVDADWRRVRRRV